MLDGRRWAGLRVGLLGGSFNPPHAGHVHASLVALAALRLDFIWWLVTPHNPLKDSRLLRSYDDRMADCRTLITHPRLIVSDLERQLGINRTFDTVTALCRHFPQTDFVWLTGLDNALSFHRWHRWRDILRVMATAHVARPPATSLIAPSPLRALAGQQHAILNHPRHAVLVPGRSYWILQRPLNVLSSTDLRSDAADLRYPAKAAKIKERGGFHESEHA